MNKICKAVWIIVMIALSTLLSGATLMFAWNTLADSVNIMPALSLVESMLLMVISFHLIVREEPEDKEKTFLKAMGDGFIFVMGKCLVVTAWVLIFRIFI